MGLGLVTGLRLGLDLGLVLVWGVKIRARFGIRVGVGLFMGSEQQLVLGLE